MWVPRTHVPPFPSIFPSPFLTRSTQHGRTLEGFKIGLFYLKRTRKRERIDIFVYRYLFASRQVLVTVDVVHPSRGILL